MSAFFSFGGFHMRSVSSLVSTALMSAALILAGALAGFAQDPCADPNLEVLDAKIRDLLTKKTLPDREAALEASKQFLEKKYGDCEEGAQFGEYLKTNIPVMEAKINEIKKAEAFQKLLLRFDAGMKTKNWDEVYAAGKLILAEKPDELIDVELVLGSIGLKETSKNPRVTKWNDETLKYAEQSIRDLEANKPFKTYGLFIKDGASFVYADKEDALESMYYTIGYIYYFGKNDKNEGLRFMYKASQVKEPKAGTFQFIGDYYVDGLQQLAKEVQILEDARDPKTDTPEVAKQKADAIKTKVGMVNGTIEAAMDAYARAYNTAKKAPKPPKAYMDSIYTKLKELYDVRFGKPDGIDSWIANVDKKPMANPLDPIQPINDTEPAAKDEPAKSGANPTETTKTKPEDKVNPTVVKEKGAVKKKGA